MAPRASSSTTITAVNTVSSGSSSILSISISSSISSIISSIISLLLVLLFSLLYFQMALRQEIRNINNDDDDDNNITTKTRITQTKHTTIKTHKHITTTHITSNTQERTRQIYGLYQVISYSVILYYFKYIVSRYNLIH